MSPYLPGEPRRRSSDCEPLRQVADFWRDREIFIQAPNWHVSNLRRRSVNQESRHKLWNRETRCSASVHLQGCAQRNRASPMRSTLLTEQEGPHALGLNSGPLAPQASLMVMFVLLSFAPGLDLFTLFRTVEIRTGC